MTVFHEPADWDFDKLGHRGKKFPSQDLTSKGDFLIIEIDGHLGSRLRQRVSDFVYYVLDGSGSFVVDGIESSCTAGNLVVVPAGSVVTYGGTMKMLLISTPPWRPEQEDVLQ